MLPDWTDVEVCTRRETELKGGRQTQERISGYRKTVASLMSPLIHVSSSTWLEMSDVASWEMLVFHWTCVVFNGPFSKIRKVQWFPGHGAGFFKE